MSPAKALAAAARAYLKATEHETEPMCHIVGMCTCRARFEIAAARADLIAALKGI